MKMKVFASALLSLFILSCAKEDIPISNIKLTQNIVFIKVGETLTLAANIDPVNTTQRDLIWITRNEAVATVTGSGNLNGIALGKTYIIISAASGKLMDSCEVFVNGTLTGTTGNEILTMSSGYANDVYYSMANGVVSTVPRTNWDMAFQTSSRSSSIIINSGAGIKLFAYPNGDIADWSSISTTGIGTWKALNNSDTTWSFGAFERNTLGHPDYGWGIYNSITHDVVGDSLFIIQLQDKSYRKLWIKKKASVDNSYIFQFANIDGSGSITDTVNCKPYPGKNFIYYSFSTKDVIDREPEADKWDFVVTRYLEMIPDESGVNMVPYPVVGVLTNSGVRAAQLDNVSVISNEYSTAHFVTPISEIGSDWKSFSMSTNQWNITGNRIYFIKDKGLSVYKLVFTGFEGSGTGVIKFSKTKLN